MKYILGESFIANVRTINLRKFVETVSRDEPGAEAIGKSVGEW